MGSNLPGPACVHPFASLQRILRADGDLLILPEKRRKLQQNVRRTLRARSRAGRATNRRARQARRTLTARSRCTRRPSSRSSSRARGRADRLAPCCPPRADQDALLGLGLDPQHGAHDRRSSRSSIVLDLHLDRRAAPPRACAAAPARGPARRARTSRGWSLTLGRRVVERALGQQRDQRSTQRRARPRPSAPRPGRPRAGRPPRAPAPRPRQRRRGRAPGRAVDLVDGGDDRHARRSPERAR